MAALLFRGELILIMDPRGARGDIGLHDLETVERPAEAGLGIGDDRREPIAREGAFLMLDLVGALERDNLVAWLEDAEMPRGHSPRHARLRRSSEPRKIGRAQV